MTLIGQYKTLWIELQYTQISFAKSDSVIRIMTPTSWANPLPEQLAKTSE